MWHRDVVGAHNTAFIGAHLLLWGVHPVWRSGDAAVHPLEGDENEPMVVDEEEIMMEDELMEEDEQNGEDEEMASEVSDVDFWLEEEAVEDEDVLLGNAPTRQIRYLGLACAFILCFYQSMPHTVLSAT